MLMHAIYAKLGYSDNFNSHSRGSSLMIKFMDIFQHKRQLLIVGIFIVADLLLISLLASAAQAHAANDPPRNHAAPSVGIGNTRSYDSPNIITDGMFMLIDNVSQATSHVEQGALNGVTSVAMSAAQIGTFSRHAVGASTNFASHGVGDSFAFVGRLAGGGFHFTGRAIGGSFVFVGRTIIGGGLSAIGHGILGSFAFAGHTIGSVFGFAAHITHVSSVIRPADRAPTPTIAQLRIQQAALIQKDTKVVTIAALTSGVGGACDAGDGNGGYPMSWCNASMDSVATIPFGGDAINRECTSYAYWYFTSIEGHTGFHATGNAKYWATTSNYPTHIWPAVGAIAVETSGAFGHVAIVQALPGQSYAGRAVPAGYVLVSEMNFDWNGHFRYSYSPLDKFSTYIYP